MNDRSLTILEQELADTLTEIEARQAEARGLARAIAIIKQARPDEQPVVVPVEIPEQHNGQLFPDAAPAETEKPRRRRRRPGTPLGQPWLRRGSAEYWILQATRGNVDGVWEVLADAGREGIQQAEIAARLQALIDRGSERITSTDSATVSRCIVALWKLGEIEWMGKERTAKGGTTIRWRLWEGEGKPPVPQQATKNEERQGE